MGWIAWLVRMPTAASVDTTPRNSQCLEMDLATQGINKSEKSTEMGAKRCRSVSCLHAKDGVGRGGPGGGQVPTAVGAALVKVTACYSWLRKELF